MNDDTTASSSEASKELVHKIELTPEQITLMEHASELLKGGEYQVTAAKLLELKDELIQMRFQIAPPRSLAAPPLTLQDVLAEFDRLAPPSESRYRSIDLEINGHGTAAWMVDWGWYARAEGADEPVSGGDFHNLSDLLADMRAKLGKPASSAPSSVEEVSQQVAGLEPGSSVAGGAQ